MFTSIKTEDFSTVRNVRVDRTQTAARAWPNDREIALELWLEERKRRS